MKLSELKKEIKDNIYEILSEESVEEGTYVGAGAIGALQKDPKFAAAKDKATPLNTLKAGGSVTLEEEDEDREPTKAELEKERAEFARFKAATIQKVEIANESSMAKCNIVSKLEIALKEEIKRREISKSFNKSSIFYFANKAGKT